MSKSHPLVVYVVEPNGKWKRIDDTTFDISLLDDKLSHLKRDELKLIKSTITNKWLHCVGNYNEFVKMINTHPYLDEIRPLYKQCGFNEQEIFIHWMYYRVKRANVSSSYSYVKPVARQDNKTVTVGSGYGGRNVIRYPCKCRKTAWKRFYKLFPHLKKEEIKTNN